MTKTVLIETSKTIVAAAPNCANEEATKTSLVLRFLTAIGYDVFNPSEVSPEHAADFSENYKNKVDYAIIMNNEPVIGIEVKTAGSGLKRHQGQLRSYFNACQTIKLGILTNGIEYECYADADEPNIMDSDPFLSFNLEDVANETASDHTVKGILDFRKSKFDPANLGTEARRKLLLNSFVDTLESWEAIPSDEFIRCMLNAAKYQGRLTSKVVEESREIVGSAFKGFVNKKILDRVGLGRNQQEPEVEETSIEQEKPISKIVTTDDEMEVYNYAIRRLSFMADTEEIFDAINDVKYQDYQTTFKVFYKGPVTGPLFNYEVKGDGTRLFAFTCINETVEIQASEGAENLQAIDAFLIKSLVQQVTGTSD